MNLPKVVFSVVSLGCAFVSTSLLAAEPAPVDTQEDAPLAAAAAATHSKVPAGVQVSVFAAEPDVKQPIGFCMDDRGRLWVAEAYSYPVHTQEEAKDRIVILEDSDGDGRHDQRKVFFEGLNYVTGIEYGYGGIWVMSPPYFYFIPDRDGDDKPDGKPELLLDGFGNHDNAHNLANGFAWGPDGWLYGTHGRTNWSMIGRPGSKEPERKRFDGGVYRYHPVQHVWEPYADGTTNPWGIDWNDYGHAFITNCVNPHLFQVIQGAHYEPWRGRKSSQYAYQRIDTIADHLHFTGLSNIRSGHGSDEEDAAGGGHAHCGTMIYLGDSFPDEYRNTLFTNNVHGRRINNDIPVRHGSGYTASHAPDLMRSADPWFMGVTLAYGPGGELYVSDWNDTGECHSTRNTRKATGRIYRLTYGKHVQPKVDLAKLSNLELAEMQVHKNDWFVRHARRLLAERVAAGDNLSAVHRRFEQIFASDPSVPRKLRAMWALYATGGAQEQFLTKALQHPDENIRSWAVTLLCDGRGPAAATLKSFVSLAQDGGSPLVRLSLASALQRIAPQDRWELASALASREDDRDDANIPLMLWYGIEPLVVEDRERFARLGAGSSIPRIRINAARRLADLPYEPSTIELLVQTLDRFEAASECRDWLEGILLGLRGQRELEMPRAWRGVYSRLAAFDDAALQQLSTELAVIFNDEEAFEQLRIIANDTTKSASQRNSAIDALVAKRVAGFDRDLLKLLEHPPIRSAVLRGLAAYPSPQTAVSILQAYSSMEPRHRQDAQLTLSSRATWASALLDAIESNQVAAEEVTAFCARQIRALGDDSLSDRLGNVWGRVRETPSDKAKEIRSIKRWLSETKLRQANMQQGKELFAKHCGTCHKFFGDGNEIGPDISGSQRNNIDYMLENIVDPNAAVARDYQMERMLTTDGRVITGLVISEDSDTLTLQTVNEKLDLPTHEIETRSKSSLSVMPEGLLTPLSDEEVRDLLGYLHNR